MVLLIIQLIVIAYVDTMALLIMYVRNVAELRIVCLLKELDELQAI